MKFIWLAVVLVLTPFLTHAECPAPIYIGRPAADEITKRNHEDCMKRELPKKAVQPQQDMVDKQRQQMQQIEQQQIQQMR